MGKLVQDLRYAFRFLTRNRGFTLAAVVTLALGIGGSTAIFSEINAFYLRPLDVHEPSRLVAIFGIDEAKRPAEFFLYTDARALEAPSGGLAGVGAHASQRMGLGVDERAEMVTGKFVSANYFSLLGAVPRLGRLFGAAEAEAGAAPVAVISHDLWTRRFGGDAGVVGRPVRVNGREVVVVGVAPRGFNGVSRAIGEDLWLPLGTYPRFDALGQGGVNLATVHLFGRLAPGATRAQAVSALNGRLRELSSTAPGWRRVRRLEAAPLTGLPQGGGSAGLNRTLVQLGTALLTLVIASVNVAGMLLARAIARRKEIAIRVALGAGQGRLVRQLLTESTVLFLAGGVTGLLFATWAAHARQSAVWPPLPVRSTLDFGIDGRVLAFVLVVSLVTSLIFGLVPALQGARADVVGTLKDATVAGSHFSRARGLFVVGQIALSFLLLVWAGLFVRGLSAAWSSDPGFRPQGVAYASLDLSLLGYPEARGRVAMDEVVRRLGSTPGIESAALASSVPFGNSVTTLGVRSADVSESEPEVAVEMTSVSADYFRVLGIPLVAGRAFSAADAAGAPDVTIVGRALARRLWGEADPVGRMVRVGTAEYRVVGVARDVQTEKLGVRGRPQLYAPAAQRYTDRVSVFVRTGGDVDVALAALRREVAAVDPNLPLAAAMPLDRMLSGSLSGEMAAARRVGMFGLTGLVIALVGLYGAISFLVLRQTRDIGIRMALGARREDVLRLVVGRGLRMGGAGVAAGVVLVLAATPLLASQIYGVRRGDPLIMGVVAAIFLAATLAAVYVPALRATRISSMVALRTE